MPSRTDGAVIAKLSGCAAARGAVSSAGFGGPQTLTACSDAAAVAVSRA